MVRRDVLQAAGPLQLCAGQPSGCEAAVRAMRAVFNSPDMLKLFYKLTPLMLLTTLIGKWLLEASLPFALHLLDSD